ncbi:MAG: tetratricopeptide repeat protein, partial [Kordia sp.]|uniref:tetratricopeptide repeat protein n=1 Tax=Kordia sp. TaxID=1965332 RepID=UPI00385CAA7C
MNTLKYIFIIIYFTTLSGVAQNVDSITALHEQFTKAVHTDFELAKSLALEAVKKSELLQDNNSLLQSYFNLSEIYAKQKKSDSAFFYTDKALKYAEKLSDYEKQALLYNRLGALSQRDGSFTKAITNQEKAMLIAEQHSLLQQRSKIHASLAKLYRKKGGKKRAFKELQKAIEIAETNNFKKELINSYNLKGLLLFNTQKDSAIHYYEKAIAFANAINDKHRKGVVLSNLADLYMSIEKYDVAFKYLTQTEKIALEVHDYSTLHFAEMSLGIYHEEIGDFPAAIRIYQKALKEYGQYIDDSQRLQVYWLLPAAYFHNKQYIEAYEYQEKYIKLRN